VIGAVPSDLVHGTRFAYRPPAASPDHARRAGGIMMRSLTVGLLVATLVAPAFAFHTELNGHRYQLHPTRSGAAKVAGPKGANLLTYHNGPVIHRAKVVSIFWGPSTTWGTPSTPSALAQTIRSFFGQFGTTPQYNVITQYYDFGGSVQLSSLSTTSYIDNSTPPVSVTDADVQNEVLKAAGVLGLDASTIYEVFLPPTSYATLGSWNSCGGPNLQFCAYHGNFAHAGVDVKYSSMPYPSCGGCQWPGWTAGQNFEHFACHETRESVSDSDGTAWFDRQGNEADDKCAWSPSPFLVNGFGYQYEWSNVNGGCVQGR
jgi:hypothetical protein